MLGRLARRRTWEIDCVVILSLRATSACESPERSRILLIKTKIARSSLTITSRVGAAIWLELADGIGIGVSMLAEFGWVLIRSARPLRVNQEYTRLRGLCQVGYHLLGSSFGLVNRLV